MNEECPVCHNQFETEESFKKHLQIHMNNSVLSKPVEKYEIKNSEIIDNYKKINLDKIYNKEKIEELIETKIKRITNTDELIDARIFIEQFKKINRKHPFCYIPYFVQNFVNGNSPKNLIKLFHIRYSFDLNYIIKNIFGFKKDRFTTKHYVNALELNLSNSGWGEKYNTLKKNYTLFEDEILETIFYNILQSHIILLLMDKPRERNELLSECILLKNNFDLFCFVDAELEIKLNDLIDSHLNVFISEILALFLDEKIISRSKNHPKELIVDISIENIKKNIISELTYGERKLSYTDLRSLINETFPALRLIPGLGVFEFSLHELESKHQIDLEHRSNRVNDYEIFLHTDYLKLQEQLNLLQSSHQKIPFHGRKITPELFVEELLELEKGDFNDEDDQVTRIAGLVLAESVSLQSPNEKIKEFDFSMNITDYDFSHEQEDAMKKLNFQINSTILHVKVMIDEIFSLKKYQNLLEKLPANEQGVVVTFKKIPLNVKKLLENNSSIQIIDEDGIKIWVSITSEIPSRVNSLCKIYSDPLSKLENKLVKINSIFYEKGIALVDVYPEMNEITVLARSLEEISLYEPHPTDFNLISKNYAEFMKILSNCTLNDDLIDGFFKNTITENVKNSKTTFKLKFEYNTVHLDLERYEKRDIFNCDCMRYAENPLQLCSHLVTALDYVFRTFSYGDESWNDSNLMKNSLESLLRENLEIILDRLDVVEEAGLIVDEHKVMNFISGVIKTKKSS